ncbi:C40 family peptidase [Modestobacter sp. VKM Ac-2979]|uniref:C40 family peptidase n=1 Tax=unclassified Modestobacter TaxID=2643866 RepID=UPI0022AB8940|nr:MULTISPECIES: C40 family peptidase [unclassified Modestobacter]MCZ2811231.1 C40 family peptidase [Modestobacter sp. VKM Ac-2979]MCZ2840744.1 C40 family peptidase [Modestobacter sp. VKM Ac-2980]
MASSHISVRRGRNGRRALLTLFVAGGVALAPVPALAAPETPTTSQEAAELIAARGHDLEVVTEKMHEATDVLTSMKAASDAAAAELVAAEAAVVEARDHVRQVARSAFTGEQLSSLQAMLTSSSADEMLDRMGTLDSIAGHNNEVLGVAQQATVSADEAKAAAEKAAADAEAQVAEVAAQQADLNEQIAEYQAEYDRLSAEERERARILAEQHAAAEAAAAAAEREAQAAAAAERNNAQTASRDERTAPAARAAAPAPAAAAAPAPAPAAPVVASSGAAATAVSTAMAQRGKPYVWGATGPNSYDCSGLVKYSYAAAGVNLPRSSRQQAASGRAVSRGELQPGDLIAYYSPVSHIGIYIGNGQMVHAPTSGDVVKVASIDAMGPITAMRRVAG